MATELVETHTDAEKGDEIKEKTYTICPRIKLTEKKLQNKYIVCFF